MDHPAGRLGHASERAALWVGTKNAGLRTRQTRSNESLSSVVKVKAGSRGSPQVTWATRDSAIVWESSGHLGY